MGALISREFNVINILTLRLPEEGREKDNVTSLNFSAPPCCKLISRKVFMFSTLELR